MGLKWEGLALEVTYDTSELRVVDFFMFIYLHLFETVEEGEIFHLLVHSSDACKSQGWTRPNPGATHSTGSWITEG